MSAPLHDDHANRGTLVKIELDTRTARELAVFASSAHLHGVGLSLALEIDPGEDRVATLQAKVGTQVWSAPLGGEAVVTVEPLYDPEG